MCVRCLTSPAPGLGELKIAPHTVGVCGSDLHYYTHGRVGKYVVEQPMILGHEASGTVVEVGPGVEGFKVGDRVAMEPGIPDMSSRASKLGMYNVDPAVRFFATPPIDGCLCETVNHPAAFTYKLPDNVSFGEGALLEPLAVGMWSATKARIQAGRCLRGHRIGYGRHADRVVRVGRWCFQGADF